VKKIIPQLIILTITALLVSSCGNLSRMSLTKRHYRSGYFVDFGGNKHVNSISMAPIQARNPIKESAIIKPIAPIAANTLVISPGKVRTTQKYVAQKKSVSIGKIVNNNLIPEKTLTVTTSLSINNKDESELDHHAQVNANVSFALIVVCAIFIPPLGVALMYGINNYFWIDLILTLLFFFPGMIFALIVVLR
jgi:uncharacterized membrane protein YqaE (UPF0057 family)